MGVRGGAGGSGTAFLRTEETCSSLLRKIKSIYNLDEKDILNLGTLRKKNINVQLRTHTALLVLGVINKARFIINTK